tara:strand:+ start:3948 stop:5024 length:1077 start_codon:yes stop_codon:yes gene_type:complete
MKILNIYLFKQFMYGFALSLIVLLSIETFLSLTGELEDLNVGNYTFLVLVKYVLLTIPRSIHDLFPYALLIGAMLSLGAMAADMEFVAMQSAGVSVMQTIYIILVQTFLISVIFYLVSDFSVPNLNKKAESIKNVALNKKVVHKANGVWFKDQNKFINIDEVYSNSKLKNISVFKYDYSLKLQSLRHIQEATFNNGEWTLKDVKETSFIAKPITTKHYHSLVEVDFISPQLLDVTIYKPNTLSLGDVMKNIKYLNENKLDDSIQKRIFWDKLFKPFSTVIMIFLAMPFLFGKYRTNTQGKRIVVGLLIGIIFFVTTTILPNLGTVIGLSPFLNVFLPNILFVAIGYQLYKNQLELGLQ